MKKLYFKINYLLVTLLSFTLTACSSTAPVATTQVPNIPDKKYSTVISESVKPEQELIKNKSLYTLPGVGKKIDFTVINDNPNYIGSLSDTSDTDSQIFLIKNKDDFAKFFSVGDPIDFSKENILAFVFISPANQFKSRIKNLEIVNNNLIVDYRYQFIYSKDQMFNDYIRPRTFMIKFNKVDFDLLAVQKQADIIE